jgi:hypothetical protein
MFELRPVNYKIGNLRGHVASQLFSFGDRLAIQFDPAQNGQQSFCVMLQGVLKFVDNGLLFQPLTAGIVWKPVGKFGREAASRLGRQVTSDLIEMRLDHENGSSLYCRFQAVASAARVWDGPMNAGLGLDSIQ